MLIIVVCTIVGFVLEFKGDNYDEPILRFFISVLCGVLGCSVGLLISMLLIPITTNIAPVENKVVEKNIYALNDTSSAKGMAYLFSGYVNDELKYRYVIDTPDGKQVKETETDNVFIKEGDYTPKIKIHKKVLKNKTYGILFFTSLSDEEKVEFYVPKNTVINEYNVDLQ